MVRENEQEHEHGRAACAVCGSFRWRPLYHLPRRQLVECRDCGHEYGMPMPECPGQRCFFPPLEVDRRATEIDVAYLEGVFRRHGAGEGRLLDVGCGRGRIAGELARRGWDRTKLVLVDASGHDLARAREACPGATVLERDAGEGLGLAEQFDCVLMVEFLEHVVRPGRALEQALLALKPGGLLVVRALPNNRSVEAFLARDRWKMRTYDGHYHFFHPETFRRLAGSLAGLELLEFGCFLQEGFRFYDVARIARDLGIARPEAARHRPATHDGRSAGRAELASLVLARLREAPWQRYVHLHLLPKEELAGLASADDLERFFDRIHLDYRLSPDFSAVLRRVS